ncbi:methyl-accepting chemotaxis protein [Rhizobacter sp. J219]|uniref:methyl-accepting chemotaxis protein n=1 Tax=Rhizobacter sp. J219 TaxID=2898430 RepID=UPI002151BD35|nr:methyl-accepting chemotaxis protein [Rhizobacter sp. J219]MCR5883286.1 methyl-accepting chemotaxis protein [Rhizobacter sp. J219]
MLSISKQASNMGREAAEVRGQLDDTTKGAERQAKAVAALAEQVRSVTQAQEEIGGVAAGSREAMARARQAVEGVGEEVGGIVDTLRHVADAAGEITQIALQTRLVAFNASVEAKRAGDAGRGFGVVADAVRELAGKVERSSKAIMSTVGGFDSRVDALAREIRSQSGAKAAEQGAFQRALADLETGVGSITTAAQHSREVCTGLNAQMAEIEAEMRKAGSALQATFVRSESFLKVSEHLIEVVAECGIETEDTPFIALAREAAGQISKLLEDAVRTGTISEAETLRRAVSADRQHQPAPAHHALHCAGRSPVPAGPRAGAAGRQEDRLLHLGRPQRLRGHAQQGLLQPAARRPGVGHRQQPLPPHLQRSHRFGFRAQPAPVPLADLPPRHGRRQVRAAEGMRRADHGERQALGRLAARIQFLGMEPLVRWVHRPIPRGDAGRLGSGPALGPRAF